MAEFEQNKVREAQAALDDARGMATRHQYLDALIVLSHVSKSPDPWLQSLVQEAEALREQVRAESVSFDQAVAVAGQEAQRLIEQFRYADAVETASRIPTALRPKPLQETLDRALAAVQQSEHLMASVEEALKTNRLTGALPKLQRLCELLPHEKSYQALARQIVERATVGAKRLVAEHKFTEAARLLSQLPEFAQTSESRKLADQVREVEWHLEQIRVAPLATPTLLAIAERLLRLLPKSPVAAKHRADIAAQLLLSPKTPGGVFPDWVPTPKRSPLGAPVDWRGDLTDPIIAIPELAQYARSHPGRFFVAIGLALHGIGQAQRTLALSTEQKRSLLNGFSLGLRRPATTAWGIDLGPSALKAVRLHWNKETQSASIDRLELLDYEVDRAASALEVAAIARPALEEFLRRHDVKGERVCTNLPGSNVLARWFSVPAATGKKLDAIVANEVRHQVPFPLDECAWDYEDEDVHTELTADATMRRFFILACKKKFVDERIELFKQLGVRIDALQSDCVALHNYSCLLDSRLPSAGERLHPDEAVVWIDIGSEVTNIVVSGPRVLWFRMIGIGSHDFTRAITGDLKLVYADANALKRDPLRARRLYLFDQAMAPVFRRLLAELQRSLESMRSIHPRLELRRAYACGGGTQLHGIMRCLKIG